MPVDTHLAKRIVDYLNDLHDLDADAVADLVDTRVPCGQKVADHPTVQCGLRRNRDDEFEFGIIGVLNGLCGCYDDGERKGCGAVAAMWDEGELVGFQVLENEG